MSSFNNKKLLLIPSLLILNFINMLYCSNAPIFKHSPLEQPNDQTLIFKRNLFDSINTINAKNVTDAMKLFMVNIFPQNEILHIYPTNSKSGCCYNDAIQRTSKLSDEEFKQLTTSKNCKIVGCEDYFTILGIPYNYFNQIKKPKLNCLATYTQNNNDFIILHMATVTHNNELISKCGNTDIVIKHEPFNLPIGYGNRIRFWELKEEYNGNENKNFLFQTLKYRIQTSFEMKKLLGFYNQTLLISTDYYRINQIIKVVMGLNLNTRNEQGKTPAMIAARKGRYDVVQLYLDYGADVNLQDKNGETLLMIAINQNNQEFVRLLLKYNANPYIKNKDGQDAFIYAAQSNNLEILAILLESSTSLPKLCLDKP